MQLSKIHIELTDTRKALASSRNEIIEALQTAREQNEELWDEDGRGP